MPDPLGLESALDGERLDLSVTASQLLTLANTFDLSSLFLVSIRCFIQKMIVWRSNSRLDAMPTLEPLANRASESQTGL